MNLIRNIALSLMLLSAVDASTTEDLVTSEGIKAPAAFCPNHQEDFSEAKALFEANLELHKTRYTQANCNLVMNAQMRVDEALASFEAIAQKTDHPDFFYAAMILYHNGIDSSYRYNAIVAEKYLALAIETCNNVLSQAGHKDTPAAGIVLESLKRRSRATFDDGIVYNGPTPFKR